MNRSTMNTAVLTLALSIAAGVAWAKLPPPTEEQKAKAAEASTKAAEAAKKEAEALAKAQDRVAESYLKAHKSNAATAKPK